MIPSLFVLIVAAAIAWIEVPRLRRRKAVPELWSFSVLLVLAASAGIAQILHVPLPNPLDLIFYLFRPISDWLSL
ncbi:hypothetical protein [Cohnella caldifontis]|uniref:hypothetical protein n=1 Tax=Cohnella caldifontis TaxID=3027471 RepID=UPI0023EA8EF4|nr:hypothetical protein [Cohnella sp. YIM B05605]